MNIKEKLDSMIHCYNSSDLSGDEGDYYWRKYLTIKSEIIQEFEKQEKPLNEKNRNSWNENKG